MEIENYSKIIKEIIIEKYKSYMPKKMYSFRIDKKIIDKAKKEA